MTPARRPRRSLGRTLALLGALAFCVPVLAFVIAHLVSRSAVRRELRAWEAAGTSMDALRARFPARQDSAAAMELDRLARALGLHLASGSESQVDDQALYAAMSKSLGQLARRGGEESTPPEARAFLDAHRAQIAAVAAYLLSASDIAWAMDIDAGPEAPIPSMLAHRYLNTILLTEALEMSRRGDAAGAERMLDAAWRQQETLAARPELIGQLIVIALAGQHGNVLRRVAGASPAWEERLQQRRFVPSVIDSFQVEAHGFLRIAQDYGGTSDADARLVPVNGPAGPFVRIAGAPWLRLSLASASRHYRRGQELARAADLCRVTGEILQTVVASEIGRWDFMSRVAVPGVMRSVTSAAGADLDSELTRLVLQARRGTLAARDVPSAVCRSVTWRQAREEDGRWTIRADPPLPRDPGHPDRWVFALAAGPASPGPNR